MLGRIRVAEGKLRGKRRWRIVTSVMAFLYDSPSASLARTMEIPSMRIMVVAPLNLCMERRRLLEDQRRFLPTL
jgi:hypothetical protein